MTEAAVYWRGSPIGPKDDLGAKIDDVFYDAKTVMGPWGILSPASFRQHGVGVGLGRGQKYEKQSDGRWLKTEG